MKLIVVLSTVAVYICIVIIGASTSVVQAADEGLNFNYTPLSNHTAPFLMPPIGDVLMQEASIELTASHNNTNLGFQNLAGRLFHKQQLQLWNHSSSLAASFNCSFSFRLQQYPGSVYSADGMAFLLVRPDASSLPPTSFGAWFGLFNSSNNGSSSNQVLAVEFDTFQNKDFLDPNTNHIGIDLNNIISTRTQTNPGFGLFNSTTFAWIDYDSPHSTLLIYAAQVDLSLFSLGIVKPVTPQLSFQVDLSQFLPENVLIGFSAATGGAGQYHTILSWSFNTTYVYHVKSSGKGVGLIVTEIVVPIATVLALIVMVFVVLRRKRVTIRYNYITNCFRRRPPALGKDHQAAGTLRSFTYKELALATNNFSATQLLGKGGFGNVYKGVLYNERGAEEIAVKCISHDARQGEKEFDAEISIISGIRHRNLVQLKGWCREKKQLMLVYEFMPNGSLDYHLYPKDKHAQPTLDCQTRFHIMCGVGYALQYLHEECEKVIVHRDLKPSNVMLDSSFNAKLGDFGLARQLKEGASSFTTMLAGTRGYMAPESVMSQRATMNGDVYSYGAMLLEVACGRHPIDEHIPEEFEWKLVDWVWSLYSHNKLHEAMDSHLSMDEEAMEILTRMMIVGLACLHPNQNSRPKISEALGALLARTPMLTITSSMPSLPSYRALSSSSRINMDHSLHSTSISNTSLELLKGEAENDLALMTWPR